MTTLATTLFSFFGSAPEDPKSLAKEVEALQIELRNLRRARFKAAPDEKENIATYRDLIKSRLKALRQRQKELCPKCLGTGENEDQHFIYKACDKCFRQNPRYWSNI